MGREMGIGNPDFGEKRVEMALRILGVTKGHGYQILEAKEGGAG